MCIVKCTHVLCNVYYAKMLPAHIQVVVFCRNTNNKEVILKTRHLYTSNI